MNKLKSQLQKIVNNELQPHERVLWAGQPIGKRMMMSAFKLWLFFIPWTGVTLFLFKDMWENSNGDYVPLLFIVPFFLIGIWMLLAPIRKLFSAGKIVYVVTNKRVMTIEAKRQVKINSFEAEKISILEKKVFSDGSGDLILSKETYLHTERRENRDRVTKRTKRRGFFAVPDVKLVEDSIRTMLRENSL